ncbi:MAG TPA: TlpA disulfide reductase family protein [Chitinophagaceae bacterium]
MTKSIFKILTALVFLLLVYSVRAQELPKWKVEDLKAAIQKTEGPTIFNFWATFCKPCIEEIPYFQELVKKYEVAGVRLVLVNLDAPDDYPARIQSFAKRFKMTAPITYLDESNADLFCPAVDEKWSGAIPASLFVNNKTGYRKFYEDQLSREELEGEIGRMIGGEKKGIGN